MEFQDFLDVRRTQMSDGGGDVFSQQQMTMVYSITVEPYVGRIEICICFTGFVRELKIGEISTGGL